MTMILFAALFLSFPGLQPFLDITTLFDFTTGLVAFLFIMVTVLVFVYIYDNLRRGKRATT